MHSKVCDLRAQLQHDQTAKLVVTEAYARAILSHTYQAAYHSPVHVIFVRGTQLGLRVSLGFGVGL